MTECLFDVSYVRNTAVEPEREQILHSAQLKVWCEFLTHLRPSLAEK